MKSYSFNKLQWYFLQFVCWAALFDSFVIFEETIIDRSAWKTLIPGYRAGEPCVWDLTAAAFFAVLVYLIFRRGRSSPDTQDAPRG